MRGTVAKRLRRRAFELSAKEPTQGKVRWYEKVTQNKAGDRRGTYYLEGYRKVYQNLKKKYHKNQKGEEL